MPIRVLFIILGHNSPSNRVRVMDLLPSIESHGVTAEVLAYPKGLAGKLEMLRRLPKYDVVVLQRKLLSRTTARLFRLLCKKIVFDFDDATYLRHDAEEAKTNATIAARTAITIEIADLIIAGNKVLQQYAYQFNDNCIVIPSCVNIDKYVRKEHLSDDLRDVVIGWIGSTANLYHLDLVREVLRNVAQKHRIILHVISGKSIDFPGVSVRFIPWTLEGQYKGIAEFDIGIMPLETSGYSAGKCGYKALQCMAAGVPVVVSNVGGSADVVATGIDGFLANDLCEFETYLEKLVCDLDLRKSMGARAREKVIRQFSVALAGIKLAEALRKLSMAEGQT